MLLLYLAKIDEFGSTSTATASTREDFKNVGWAKAHFAPCPPISLAECFWWARLRFARPMESTISSILAKTRSYFAAEKRLSNEFDDTIGGEPAIRPSFAGGAAAAG